MDEATTSQEINQSLEHDSSDAGSSSSSDYVLSDEEGHFTYPSLSDHSAYLAKSLSHALDSVALDKLLALEAQLSGHVNYQNNRILDKRQQLVERLERIQALYDEQFRDNRLGNLHRDLADLEGRLDRLMNGKRGLLHRLPGVAERYPIEFNQAKDKVVERQTD